jgi:hypothetical protein
MGLDVEMKAADPPAAASPLSSKILSLDVCFVHTMIRRCLGRGFDDLN